MNSCSRCIDQQHFLMNWNDGSQVVCYRDDFEIFTTPEAEDRSSTTNRQISQTHREKERENEECNDEKHDSIPINQGEVRIINNLPISIAIPPQDEIYFTNDKSWLGEVMNRPNFSFLDIKKPAEKELKQTSVSGDKMKYIPLICDICEIGSVFKSRKTLYAHMRRTHNAEKEVTLLKSRFRVGDDKRRRETKRLNNLNRQLAWMKRINDCTNNVILTQSNNEFGQMYYNNKKV